MAATSGADEQSNPNKVGTNAAGEWNEGFQAGAFNFDEDVEFNDGFAAFRRGALERDCPHLSGSASRAEWLYGWRRARARDEENDKFLKAG